MTTQAKANERIEHVWFWPVAGIAFFLSLWLLKSILLPFVIGLAVAYFLDPLADRIEKWGASRTFSTAVVLLSFAALFMTACALAFPVLQQQLAQFAEALPAYIQKARTSAMPFIERVHEHLLMNKEDIQQEASGYAAKALGWVSATVAGIWNGGMAVVDVLSVMIVSPVVSFYLLRDWDLIVAKVDSWLPRRNAATIRSLVKQMDTVISGFVHGQAMVCAVLAILYGVALTAAGLNFGFLIGVLAGILSFIPYVGCGIGFVTAILVAWFQFDGETARLLIVAAIFGAGQLIEGNFLTPKLVGEKVGLHAVWILFALMAGGALMGFTGVMIAVPAAAVIGVLIRFAIGEYLKSAYYTGGTKSAKS